jgi:trehalose synthase-fused probable maltokinase
MTAQSNAVNELHERVNRRLAEALPSYLPARRWFGDKARTITRVEVIASFPIDELGKPAAFNVIEVSFGDGNPARYVLPVVIDANSSAGPDVIATLETGESVRDALTEPDFRSWMLELLIDGSDRVAGAGRLEIDALAASTALLTEAGDLPSRVLGVEQSNSSIVYGATAFIKLFRRLQPGINPDLELTRFLTAKSAFANVPAYLGAITYRSPEGEQTVVAVAQAFVDAVGDGWSFVLDLLRSHLDDAGDREFLAESTSVARRLGEITAEMHVALTADPWSQDLAPEPVRQDDVERWSRDYLEMLDLVVAGIERTSGSIDGQTQELVDAFLRLAPGLRARTAGFDRLLGRAKTRVHGDYHLGQTLRTSAGDFAVIDFEGEPQRTITERRRKTSPLKDVAGMLRSFSYARGTAHQWLREGQGLMPSDLVAWERMVRQAFIDAYVQTARANGAAFLPKTDADLDAALRAWELDKAVYEVQYELNNRPDWLWIPLSAMIKQGEPDR